MLISLLLASGCITVDNGQCSNQEYRALNGDCVQDPGPTDIEVDTASDDLDLDADASSDGSDGGDGGDADGPDGGGDGDDGTADADGTDADADGSGDAMIESADISCDAGSWNYNISTAIPTESAAVTVTETGDPSGPVEFHTLVMAGASSSGGETYERELLLVTDYYFEDVATQFACTDGTNADLTWRIDLYSDAARSVPLGCVSWGHDASADLSSGCQSL